MSIIDIFKVSASLRTFMPIKMFNMLHMVGVGRETDIETQ